MVTVKAIFMKQYPRKEICTGNINMHRTIQTVTRLVADLPQTITLETTLYDLIEAVSAEVNCNEEQWIPLIVNRMLCSARSSINP